MKWLSHRGPEWVQKIQSPEVLFPGVMLVCGLFASLGFVLKYTAWNGHVSIEQNLHQQESAPLGAFDVTLGMSDVLRNTRTGEYFQRLSGESAAITAEVPRAFDSVTTTLKYVPGDQRIIEFGIVQLASPLSVLTQPVDLAIVREATKNEWVRTEDAAAGVALYTPSDVQPKSLHEALKNGDARVGLYSGVEDQVYRELSPNAFGSIESLVTVGTYAAILSPDSGQSVTHISFDYQDSNASVGADPLTVSVLDFKGALLAQEKREDDGVVVSTQSSPEWKHVDMEIPTALHDQLYRFELSTSNDVIVKNMHIEHGSVAVRDQLTIDTDDSNAELSVFGNHILAKSIRSSEISHATVNGVEYSVSPVGMTELFQKPQQTTSPAEVQIHVAQHGEVRMKTTGLITSQLINTHGGNYFHAWQMRTLDEDTMLTDVDMIVVPLSYHEPVDGYVSSTQTIMLPITGVLGDHKKLQFMLKAPAADVMHTTVDVTDVQMRFDREGILQRVLNKISPKK